MQYNNSIDGRQGPRSTGGQGGGNPRSGQSNASRSQSSRRPSGGGNPQNPRSGGQPPSKRPPQRKVSNRWFRALLMVVATIGGCIFLAVFILRSAFDMFGLNQVDNTIEVEIPEGATLAQVSDILKGQGVVDQSLTFRMYAGIKLEDEEIQGGSYAFNSNLSYDEIILGLKSGYSTMEEVTLTFREGRTLREIADILEEYEVCDAQEFIDYLNTAELDYEFMNGINDSSLRYNRLEGYVFPDTYDFFVGEGVDSVARKFLRNFDEKINEDFRRRMQEMNLTLDETIILASIIQKEAGRMEDMRMVSSAFHNRRGNTATYPKMQSDVTILYVNSDIKPYLEQQNQEMYDAYNTYICDGLPVGAICNPGLEAIRAALYPAESDYYFFVTDIDGKFYYSETPDEHYQNVSIAMSVGGEVHGIDTQD